MCLMLLVFVLLPLILVGAVFFAFVWVVSALLLSIQDKKSGGLRIRTKEEKEKIVALQIVCSAVLMFIAFIIYLCVRYGVS